MDKQSREAASGKVIKGIIYVVTKHILTSL